MIREHAAQQKQEAYQRLRPLLLHGQIPPGTRLGEVEWSNKLGVYRGALREAFGLLVHEGLLAPGQRGGIFVPCLEKTDLDEILELRVTLEVAAIHRMDHCRQSIDVKPLHAICQTMRDMWQADMPLGFVEADRKFHEQIITLAGNRRMMDAYLHAPTLITLQMTLDHEALLATLERALNEHEKIYEHLACENFERAAELLKQHLLHSHSSSLLLT